MVNSALIPAHPATAGGMAAPDAVQRAQVWLTESRLTLRQAKTLPEKCPHWWAVAQQVGLGQSWDRRTYEGLLTQAIDQEPAYTPYYFQMLVYLLPARKGAPGDAVKFALAAADKVVGEDGDVLYARMLWFIDRQRLGATRLQEPAVSWEKLDRGFEILTRRYPASLTVQSEWARLARLSSRSDSSPQRTRAADIFSKIGPRIDTSVWTKEAEFIQARKWALRE
jgi:hypothetical protein